MCLINNNINNINNNNNNNNINFFSTHKAVTTHNVTVLMIKQMKKELSYLSYHNIG